MSTGGGATGTTSTRRPGVGGTQARQPQARQARSPQAGPPQAGSPQAGSPRARNGQVAATGSGGGATASRARRGELAAFLRSRRERIGPEQVGLPVGYRRRTPGLRREEVAQLAGVGVTWYTWLEQGRPINASVQVLDAVARVLRLDAAEREHLYRLADLPEVARPGEPEVIEPEVHTILAALTPLPAAVYSARYDLLAWNDAYAVVFPVIVAEPASTRNALWWLFTQPGCRSPLVDLERELSRMVATMRASFARHVGEPAWTSFIRRLSAASPEFARMWAMHDVAYHGRREKVFTHEEAGILRLTSTSLDLPSPPDTRLVAYTPTDDETRERLGRLMADHEAAAPRRSGGV